MLSRAVLADVERHLGVSLTFAPRAHGWVTTSSPSVAVRRDATRSVPELTEWLATELRSHGLTSTIGAEGVSVDVCASHAWLANLWVPRDVLKNRGVSLPSGDYREYGRDAARWAWALQASKSSRLEWGKPGQAWASRRDENPLALIRWAHARATLITTERMGAAAAEKACFAGREPDADLRTQLALVSQISQQVERTGRTRGLLVHLEVVARQVLVRAEQQPAERTDLHAFAAARTLMANVASAMDVPLPVPF